MEELHRTQEYAADKAKERRETQKPYEGDDRRRPAPAIEEPGEKPEIEEPPVSKEDGTRRG